MNTYSLSLTRSFQQYAYHADNSNLSPTGDFTLEAWIYLNSIPTGTNSDYVIVGKYLSPNDRSYKLTIISATDAGGTTPAVTVDISASGNQVDTFQFAYDFSKNTWYHIAIVFTSASAQIQLYVNAVSQGSITKTNTSVYHGAANFVVGGYESGNTSNFDGLIDEVRLWGITRSSSDISTNYQRELAGNETNLLGYWTFDNTYNDKTSNGDTLTPSGSVSFSTNVPFADNTTTSTSSTTTSTSTTVTTSSTSITTSTSVSTSTSTTVTTSSTSITTSTSSSTSTTLTVTTTSTTVTTTSTTTTSTSTSQTTSTSTSTSTTIDLMLVVERFQ